MKIQDNPGSIKGSDGAYDNFREITEAKKNKIIAERTRKTARKLGNETYSGKFTGILVLELSSELYAIESAFIKEVLPLKEYTPVPGVPPFIKGIFNYRGKLLTLIDTSSLFKLGAKSAQKGKYNIIITTGNVLTGFMADSIKGVRNLREDEIREKPAVMSGTLSQYLKWITKDQLPILDVEKIMKSSEFLVDETNE